MLPSFWISGKLATQRMPFRLRVLRNLTSIIENVNPSNGFHYDLRGCVFRGRDTFGPEDPLPMVSILEAPIPLETILSRNTNTASSGDWELLIQGFVPDDPLNPTDPGHHLMAEVKAVLVEDKRRDRSRNMLNVGGRIAEMKVGQGSVRPADEASDKAFFWLTLTLKMAEDLADPYQ